MNLELEDGGVKLFSPRTRDSGQCTRGLHYNVATLSVKTFMIVNLCHSVHYEKVPMGEEFEVDILELLEKLPHFYQPIILTQVSLGEI